MTRYVRFIACWHVPYLLLATEVRKILRSGKGDPELTLPLLRSALARVETGEVEVAHRMGRIRAGLPQSQNARRRQLVELRAGR